MINIMESTGLSDEFDWKFYCYYYGDLTAAGINTEKKALEHYSIHGKNENRTTNFNHLRQLNIYNRDDDIPIEEISANKIFHEITQQFCNNLSQNINIMNNFKVVEIGSNVGIMSLAFGKYLSNMGSYHGIDSERNCIDWCKEKISSIYHNCHFYHIPHHEQKLNTLRLPFESESIDLVFSTNLLLSLMPEEVKIFLQEISRILKPGGRCAFMCFLWNPFIENTIKDHRSGLKLAENCEKYRIITNIHKEKTIAYSESIINEWIQSSKFHINEIMYGSWSGNSSNNLYQDIIIFKKL